MVIKLYAFELDYVLWDQRLGATQKERETKPQIVTDNLRLRPGNNQVVEDRSNPNNFVRLHSDVAQIFQDAEKNHSQIAITSNNGFKDLCDRALWLFRAPNSSNSLQPITTFIKYDENSYESKVEVFKQIQIWSGIKYTEMIFFDLDCPGSQQVQRELGVNVKVLDPRHGLTWKDYIDASQVSVGGNSRIPVDLARYTDIPALGLLLGRGEFGELYQSAHDTDTVIKKLKNWKPEFQQRFITIYNIVESGCPFEPDISQDVQEENFLSMIALELRNLRAVGELKAPLEPEEFCGWFSMKYIHGRPIWDNPLYQCHPFSVPFQTLLKRAFHLTVDEIETFVRKGGMEHRDAHLANVRFSMDGDKLTKAHIFDWGFVARMIWDGGRYVRANDTLVWNSGEVGAAYTPEQFRRYWVEWMVKTEYEAQIKREAISREDVTKFLKDLKWWF